ncbi:MAG: MBL fold metallo-hydrolase [Deltaproteobacteria bacterium]|nr:MBL fold metallo-hydrolase [Candidatus Zymogenaceae bacterium]
MPVAHIILTSMDISVGGFKTRLPIMCTLVEDGERLMLFDTGYWAGEELTAGLSRLKFSRADVTHVFLTHFHGDHAGGAALFSGAVKIASRRENDFSRNWLKKFVDARDRYRYVKDFFPYLPDVIIRERSDMLLEHSRYVPQYWWDGILEGYAWIEDEPALIPDCVTPVTTPGHTPHHTSYVIKGRRGAVLVAGDALSRRTAGTDGSPLDEPNLDLTAYKKSAEMLRSIPSLVVPAHDRPFVQGCCPIKTGKRVEF